MALAALSLLACRPKAFADNPDLVTRIKSAKQADSLRSLLIRAGVPAGQLDSLGKRYAREWGIAPASLKRAETFQADLDGDGAKERVTQFFFEFPLDPDRSEVERLYFVLIHKDKVEGKPLDSRCFPMLYCGYTEKGGMTFAFKGKAKRDVVFSQAVVEGCGLQVSMFEKEDTLRYANGAYEYIAGRKHNESFLDRMQLTDTNAVDTTP